MDNFVGCIISSDTTTIGIAAEVIKELSIEDFEDLWCENEWDDIQNNDLDVFYKYWTSKEAVVKAIGKGLSISHNEINVKNGIAKMDN